MRCQWKCLTGQSTTGACQIVACQLSHAQVRQQPERHFCEARDGRRQHLREFK
jgi:hypothetical protein